jgi:hypothetical protein
VTRLVTTLACAGLVLTLSPAAAQLPENWTTVDILAVKWMTGGTLTEVQILDDEAFHDAAIVKDGEELEWILTCIQCESGPNPRCTACNPDLQFAILDLHFVADLDLLSESYIDFVRGRPESDPFPVGVPPGLNRGHKRRQFNGFPAYSSTGPPQGKGAPAHGRLASGVLKPGPGASSEIWKYTITVEEPPTDPAREPHGCLQFHGAGPVTLDASCCASSTECDTWDPHVYTHPARPK